jgi:hypothetical protein
LRHTGQRADDAFVTRWSASAGSRPLALRIAGARLATQPDKSVAAQGRVSLGTAVLAGLRLSDGFNVEEERA